MAVTGKDVRATIVTALVVLVYAAARAGWGVPLIGSSYRWAAGAILLLGMLGCGQGSRTTGRTTVLFGVLGVAALACAVVALVTASLTALTLLVAATVLLWALSTARHASHASARPAAV